MGQGSTRKKSDLVIITPKKKKPNGDGSSSGSTGGVEPQNSIDIDIEIDIDIDIEECPPSLKIGFSQDVNLPDGTKLTIRKEEKGIALYFGDSVLVKLVSKMGRLIAFCIIKGLHYEASIMREGSSVYAKIIRKS